MAGLTDRVVKFTAREQAELVTEDVPDTSLEKEELQCRTLVSLISAGTEVVGMYAGNHENINDTSYPMGTGYAAVLEVEKAGKDITDLKPGDIVFAPSNHRLYQKRRRNQVVPVPEGLAPEQAVFARMFKISMPSFVHTSVRPPEIAVITGLGTVGLCAAQLAHSYGYRVFAADPDVNRQKTANSHGIENTASSVSEFGDILKNTIGLGIECSGHEQATLDLCRNMRTRGEVFMVGVPWVARTEMKAQEILHAVFYNYVSLNSGWEGRMPNEGPHSQTDHFRSALDWLKEGRIGFSKDVYRLKNPEDCQEVYQDLLKGRTGMPAAMFDWRQEPAGS